MATPDAAISELESGLNQPAYARGLRRGTREGSLRGRRTISWGGRPSWLRPMPFPRPFRVSTDGQERSGVVLGVP
jgi:hypothetical protein